MRGIFIRENPVDICILSCLGQVDSFQGKRADISNKYSRNFIYRFVPRTFSFVDIFRTCDTGLFLNITIMITSILLQFIIFKINKKK